MKVLSMRRYTTLPKILMSLLTHASRTRKNMHGDGFKGCGVTGEGDINLDQTKLTDMGQLIRNPRLNLKACTVKKEV